MTVGHKPIWSEQQGVRASGCRSNRVSTIVPTQFIWLSFTVIALKYGYLALHSFNRLQRLQTSFALPSGVDILPFSGH